MRTSIFTNTLSRSKAIVISLFILVLALTNAKGYTLTYLPNTPTGATVTGMPTPDSYNYSSSTLISTPSAPSCEGYTFAGWNYDGSGTVYNTDFTAAGHTWSADITNAFTTPLMDVDLTAQWSKKPTLSKTTTIVSDLDEDGNPTEALRWENKLTITGDATAKQLDVVLVIDISKSMYIDSSEPLGYGENSPKMAAVKRSAENFIRSLTNAGHRVALVYFGNTSSSATFSTDSDDLLSKLDNIKYSNSESHSTNISKGIDEAYRLVKNHDENSNKVVTLLLGDGAPTDADYSSDYSYAHANGDPIYVNIRRLTKYFYGLNLGVDTSPFGIEMHYNTTGGPEFNQYFTLIDYNTPANSNKEYLPFELIDGTTYGDHSGFSYKSNSAPEDYTGTAPISTQGYFSRELSSSADNFQSGGYYAYHTNEIRPFTDLNDPSDAFTWPILEQLTSWSADRLKTISELYVVGFELSEIPAESGEAGVTGPLDFFSSLRSDDASYISANTSEIEDVIDDLSEVISDKGYHGILEDNLPTYLDLEIPEDAIEDPTDLYSWSVTANTDGVDREYTLTYSTATSQIGCDVGNLDFLNPIVFTYYTTLADDFDYTDSSIGTTYDSEGNLILHLPLNGYTSLEYSDNTNTDRIISVDPPIGDIPVSLSIEKRVVSSDTYETITAGDGIVTNTEFNAIDLHPSTDPLLSKDVYYIFRVTNNSYEEVQNIIINDVVASTSGSDKTFPTTDPFELKEEDDENGDDSKIFVWDQEFGDEYSITENTATLEIEPQGATSPHVIQFESNTVFVERPYTVTYDDGVSDSDPDQVVAGTVPTSETDSNATPMGTPAAPTRDGYLFTGWKYEGTAILKDFDNSTVRINPGDNFEASISSTTPAYLMPASDFTLTAQWDRIYIITFNPSGGTSSTDADQVKDNSGNIYFEYTANTLGVTAKLPTKEGNQFLGWHWNGAAIANSSDFPLDTDNYFDSNITDAYSMPASDLTLYALWGKIETKISSKGTFDSEYIEYPGESSTEEQTSIDYKLEIIPEAYKTSIDAMGFKEIVITIPMPEIPNGDNGRVNLKAYATSNSFNNLSTGWTIKYYDSSNALTNIFEEVTSVELTGPYSSDNLYQYNSNTANQIEFEFTLKTTEGISEAHEIELNYEVTAETEHAYGTEQIDKVSEVVITDLYPVWNVIYHNTDFTSGIVPVDTNNYLPDADSDNEVEILGNSGNLVRSLYTFGGWQTDEITGTDQLFYTGLGDDTPDFDMPNNDVNFYPIWISVKTTDVSNISETEAVLHGEAISGVDIKYYGFIYSTEKYLPEDLEYNDIEGSVLKVENEIALNPTVDATSLGAFSTGSGNLAALPTLINRTGCYFRAFIKQSNGTIAYGEVIRFITEKRDFSLELDGESMLVTDEINTTETIDNWGADNQFAVDFWIRADETNSDKVIISTESNSKGYSIILSDGKIKILNTTGSSSISTDAVNDGEWHHIAISCDDNTEIFIDGTLSSTNAITYTKPTTEHNMTIGGVSGGSNNLKGNLDALRFWNRSLTLDQIELLMYDNIQASTNGGVEIIGSGTEVSGLTWDNLTASFGFNVCSTLEVTPTTPTTIVYENDDSDDSSINNLKGNRFFHEDSKQRINLAVIGSAKPSVDLPRVNWRHNSDDQSWIRSSNWSGYAYPGQGVDDNEVSLGTYLDVTTEVIEDDYKNAKYSVINSADDATNIAQVNVKLFPNTNRATPLELSVDVLVDMDNSIGTYDVQPDGELTIYGKVVPEISGERVKNHNGGKITVHSGSIEPHK